MPGANLNGSQSDGFVVFRGKYQTQEELEEKERERLEPESGTTPQPKTLSKEAHAAKLSCNLVYSLPSHRTYSYC